MKKPDIEDDVPSGDFRVKDFFLAHNRNCSCDFRRISFSRKRRKNWNTRWI